MYLSARDVKAKFTMNIYESFEKDERGQDKRCVSFIISEISSAKKIIKDNIDFDMELDDVKQLHSFLGNILKSDWAKQKY